MTKEQLVKSAFTAGQRNTQVDPQNWYDETYPNGIEDTTEDESTDETIADVPASDNVQS